MRRSWNNYHRITFCLFARKFERKRPKKTAKTLWHIIIIKWHTSRLQRGVTSFKILLKTYKIFVSQSYFHVTTNGFSREMFRLSMSKYCKNQVLEKTGIWRKALTLCKVSNLKANRTPLTITWVTGFCTPRTVIVPKLGGFSSAQLTISLRKVLFSNWKLISE